MKLAKALELAKGSELETLYEAYMNIMLHRNNLFSYADIADEVTELQDAIESKFSAFAPAGMTLMKWTASTSVNDENLYS